jgi:hypothetical protein
MKPIYWLLIVIIIGVLIYLIVNKTINPVNISKTTEAVKCGDRTLYRYNDPDQAFPEMTKDYETNFSIASGVLDKLAGDNSSLSLSLGVKDSVRVLIDTLNQDNIFYQTTLKAYFIESNNDPCNDSLRNRYLAFIAEMADNEMKLKEFISQASTPASSTSSQSSGSDKVLAVVDTSGGKVKVDTAVHNTKLAADNKILIMKNYAQLHSAINTLAIQYKPGKTLIRHQ